MILLLSAAVLFLAFVFGATHITRRSLAALGQEDKAKLVDATARAPLWGLLAMVVLIGAWIAVITTRPGLSVTATGAVMAAWLVLVLVSSGATYRRYQRIGLPASFLHDFLLSRGLRFASLVVLFAAAAVWIVNAPYTA